MLGEVWVNKNVEIKGMVHGRYYFDFSITGTSEQRKNKVGFAKSSISGETFSALRNYSISVLTAMESTGYSRESLATFKDPKFQQDIQKEKALRKWDEAQSKKELDRRNHCEAERALGRKCE
jgi:hypothetical protein